MKLPLTRSLIQFLIVSAFATALPAVAQTAGDYRSAASGNWNVAATWETYDGANWNAASVSPTDANANVITIQSPYFVTNSASVSADQVMVAAGGTLVASANFTATNGTGTDLDIFGTFIAVGGGSSLTIGTNSLVVVESGGVFIHNGTSTACVNNAGGTLQFVDGGKFQLQRSGATIPIAAWSTGSTCEIAYGTASASKPNPQGQTFGDFVWNNPLQSGSTDLAGSLTNVNGNFLLNSSAGLELKWSGDANFGSNLTVSNGTLNVSGSTATRVWTLKGNLYIAPGAAFNVSAGSGGSYTMIVNGTGVQNYTCDGLNTATKLNWTINSDSTLNLNNDLPLGLAGRTFTVNGTVNLNGHMITTDFLAGTNTIRNGGGGNGLLVLGAGNGNNTLDGTVSLLDGTSGTLGLVKGGNSGTTGFLTITAPQTFSGGLLVSNGVVLINNSAGSGTGSGGVTVLKGTIGGTGSVTGPVTISSGTLSPGAGGIGTFTINGTLNLSGNMAIEVNKGVGQDQVVATTVNYGGTLVITNLGGALAAGDSFPIFTVGTPVGNFTSIVPDPGPNLTWAFDPATGVLSVATVAVNPPPTLSSVLAGNTMTFSWTDPTFKLQSQTNDLGANWFDYPGGAMSPVDVVIDPANQSVFFRLSQ